MEGQGTITTDRDPLAVWRQDIQLKGQGTFTKDRSTCFLNIQLKGKELSQRTEIRLLFDIKTYNGKGNELSERTELCFVFDIS